MFKLFVRMYIIVYFNQSLPVVYCLYSNSSNSSTIVKYMNEALIVILISYLVKGF